MSRTQAAFSLSFLASLLCAVAEGCRHAETVQPSATERATKRSQKPVYPGPLISLADVAVVSSSSRAETGPDPRMSPRRLVEGADFPVTVQDRRPDWQRSYYAGSFRLNEYSKARVFLPMQNFDPTIESSLATVTQRALKGAGPVHHAELTVRSFEFVLDATELQRRRFWTWCSQLRRELDELERHRKKWHQKRDKERRESERDWERQKRDIEREALRSRKKKAKQEELSFGEEIASEVSSGVIQLALDGAAYSRTPEGRREQELSSLLSRLSEVPCYWDTKTKTVKIGLPPEEDRLSGEFLLLREPLDGYPRPYPAGYSCRIEVEVRCQWEDGRRATRSVVAAGDHPQHSGRLEPEAVRQTIHAMFRDFARQVESIAQH